MPIEDFNEDTEDTGEGGASSKPILVVGILGLAVVLAIATVFLFMSDKNPSGGEPVARPQTEQVAAPTEAAPSGDADPLADLLGDLDNSILDQVAAGDGAADVAADATPADDPLAGLDVGSDILGDLATESTPAAAPAAEPTTDKPAT